MLRWALVVLVSVWFVGVSSTFNPNRCRFIDKTNFTSRANNYLFRGDEPLYANDTFSYSALIDTARKVAMKNNFSLPDSVYLLDLNLLTINWYYEYIEIDYFKKYPTRGRYINWPTLGDLTDPSDIPEWIRKPMAKGLDDWQPDQLPLRMRNLRAMLQSSKGPNGESVLIYVHCAAGEDRTGEISAAYYMKWLQWSYTQALDYDNHIEARHIAVWSKNAMQWYCYYLVYVEGRKYNCAYQG
eukprot:TRINITY_DN1711_c0_g1_i1.p1 TRINITY_DN1711_c0_g1~~TRINITY_DN1711_c0_g1_i1.p1  ORF type:complete len:241 (+),score=18.66 TRINITY_DN1711_c0_g1_i1:91-813(+)